MNPDDLVRRIGRALTEAAAHGWANEDQSFLNLPSDLADRLRGQQAGLNVQPLPFGAITTASALSVSDPAGKYTVTIVVQMRPQQQE
jgi:hypothetical protein